MKNTSFRRKSIPVLLISFFLLYFYSGLQNDHLNVLTPYYSAHYGWDSVTITNPVTCAGFVGIVATFLVGTLLIRVGIKKILIPSMIILALAAFGLACAGDNAVVYFISLFTLRLFVIPLTMGGFMLCTNWFVKQRGRALGIIASGHQVCTATLISGLTYMTTVYSFKAAYILVGVIILVLAVYASFFVKSTPEECGFFPDGADAPVTNPVEQQITFREVFSNKNSWLLVISFGFLQFCIVAIMAFYVTRLSMVGTASGTYLLWLSVAAFLGIPLAFLLGSIDDKMGTVAAAIVLACFFLVATVFLRFMQKDNIIMIICAALGIAGMTGGTSVIHPSITAYVYGRENYQAANRWIMAVQAVIAAFAVYFMSAILTHTGTLDLAYEIMMGMIVVAMACFTVIGRTPDYDRSCMSMKK